MADPSFAFMSNTDEWHTPDCLIYIANSSMATIDLDPASNYEANQAVGASNFYTKEDDGLTQDWYGNVFLNPPYSIVSKFVSKAIKEYESGRVKNCFLIVNASTDTKWFLPLFEYLIWFPSGRVKFNRPDGSAGGSPAKGTAVVLMSKDEDVILRFKHWCAENGPGAVVTKCP